MGIRAIMPMTIADRTLVTRMLTALRGRLDRTLDWVRLQIDGFPAHDRFGHVSPIRYQPIPALGIGGGGRAAGTATRWEKMDETLTSCGVSAGAAVDIGANSGYFSIALGRRGFDVLAIEPLPPAHRTIIYAVRKAGLAERVAVSNLTIAPHNIDLIPNASVVVFLSLWHHLARAHGLPAAETMLSAIWAKTGRVMFFDTGESEMPPEYGLPVMEPDAQTWLGELLLRTCPGAEVRHLGLHQAFDADRRPATRNLYAVIRIRE